MTDSASVPAFETARAYREHLKATASREELVGEINSLETKNERLREAIEAAKAMRERIRQEDGGADEWGRWYECAAFDDALNALEGGNG